MQWNTVTIQKLILLCHLRIPGLYARFFARWLLAHTPIKG